MEGRPTPPEIVSDWLWKQFDRPRGDLRSVPVLVGGMIAYLLLFSGLPPKAGWIAEAATGAALVAILFWKHRRRPWYRHGVALSALGTAFAFSTYGDFPFDERTPVIFVVAVGWALGFGSFYFLERRVPTTKSARQSEVVLLLFALLVVGIFSGVIYMYERNLEVRQQGLETRARYVTPRSAYSIERCFMGQAKGRFDYSPQHPERRSRFISSHNVRWTVVDRGETSVLEMALPKGEAVTPALDAEAKRCATPE